MILKIQELTVVVQCLSSNQTKDFFLILLLLSKISVLEFPSYSPFIRQPNIKHILKTSLIILVTAETACILTAETVDLIFYKQSMLLSIPLALLAGTLVVVLPEAYKKTRKSSGLNRK